MPIPSGANANGKRPIQTISNGSGGGGDDQEGPSVESFDIDSSLGEEDTELGRTAAAMALSNNSNSTGNGAAAAASGKKKNEFAAKTHQPSGYTWSRTEDEPGYAWTNKKAVDESARAWEGLSFREGMVNSELPLRLLGVVLRCVVGLLTIRCVRRSLWGSLRGGGEGEGDAEFVAAAMKRWRQITWTMSVVTFAR